MKHYLKLNIIFCDAVNNGEKTFEVRKNDRGFQKGDKIEFIPVDDFGKRKPHAIATKEYLITYVLTGWGIENEYCVFAIKEIIKGGGK